MTMGGDTPGPDIRMPGSPLMSWPLGHAQRDAAGGVCRHQETNASYRVGNAVVKTNDLVDDDVVVIPVAVVIGDLVRRHLHRICKIATARQRADQPQSVAGPSLPVGIDWHTDDDRLGRSNAGHGQW